MRRWVVDLVQLFWRAFGDFLQVLRSLFSHWSLGRRRSRRDEVQSDRDRRRASSRCVPIDEWAYKRPDPTIYSQLYLMALGFGVTWDNPDIQLYRNGIPVPSCGLDPDAEYVIEARVWNNSVDAPVVGMPVHFGYLSFGAGTQLHKIGMTRIDVGVKGAPNTPGFARVTWRTPPRPGHYCVQVLLEWSDDLNPFNNLGSENTDVVDAHSDAEFTFQVRNESAAPARYRFETDAYAIPPRSNCEERARRPAEPDPAVPADHDPRNYPLPPGWEVSISPATLDLLPDEEQTVHVAVAVADDFVGRQPVNVRVYGDRDGLGGVTVYVEKGLSDA